MSRRRPAVGKAASRRLALALAAATLLWAGAAAGQEARGRLTGQLRSAHGDPVEGATVWLWPSGQSEAAAIEMQTDAQGRWARGGLAPGRWEIRARAAGHVDGRGWVEIPQRGAAAPVQMELRSLDEESAAFSEGGSSGTLATWIERANSFLAQGRSSEARDEFSKALTLLPLERRPEVLRAVARTWYLEGELQNALDAVEEALRIAPGDAASRVIYRGLLEERGLGAEADRRLAEIEAAGPPPEPPPPPSRSFRSAEASPAEAPVAHRTGGQRLAFSEASPLGEVQAYAERFDLVEELKEAPAELLAPRSLTEEAFQVYVPETYTPEAPHGLLVWVSPTPFGGFRDPEFPPLFSRKRLIWVGADRSGNSRPTWDRTALALDAVHNMSALYSIDPERVYIAGYSGGGRLSSSLAMIYPDVFSGGVFFYGCNWFERLPVPDKPGSLWPEKFRRPPELARVKRESRLVFVTGELDFNRQQTRATFARAREMGFEHVTYLEIPGANHYYGVPAEWLERALDALAGG